MAVSGYAGKINNKGNQKVDSVYKSKSVKSPKVITGGDLRAKKSNK